MRIDARLEATDHGLRPILFFPDDVQRDKTIGCFTLHDGHNTASRAYMRKCREPVNPDDFASVYRLLAGYCGDAVRYASKR